MLHFFAPFCIAHPFHLNQSSNQSKQSHIYIKSQTTDTQFDDTVMR